MSCPETLVIRRGYAGHLVEDTAGGFPVDRTPTETCLRRFNKYHGCKVNHLHAICSIGERLNHKFFVLQLPSPHDLLRIQVNDGPNIVCNIFLLSTLVMKGDSPRGQGFNDVSYINFGAAGDTDMKIQKKKVNKLFQKLKNCFAR